VHIHAVGLDVQHAFFYPGLGIFIGEPGRLEGVSRVDVNFFPLIDPDNKNCGASKIGAAISRLLV